MTGCVVHCEELREIGKREEQVVVGDMCVRLRPLEKSTNLKILLRTTFTYTHQTLDADGARASLENLMEGT